MRRMWAGPYPCLLLLTAIPLYGAADPGEPTA